MFRDRRLIQFLQRPAEYTHAVFSTALDPNVFVLRLVPGMRADIIPMLEGRYRAWCWKLWRGRPARRDDGAMFAAVRDWCGAGHWLCSPPRYRMRQRPCRVRSWPRGKSPAGVLEAHDMTPEATAVKLMWVLGQTTDRAEAEKLFLTPVQWDIL